MNYDSFANPLDVGANQSGFTNNFLEARSNIHNFEQQYSDYRLFAENEENKTNNMYRDIVKTAVERTPLSDAFFSDVNINFIKEQLAQRVYDRSGGLYKITPQAQSSQQLAIVMSSIFMDHAKHWPDRLPEQIRELNKLVLADVVPRTLSNIQLELSNRRDAGQQPLTLDLPLNVSSAGTRSNQPISTLFI